MPRRVDPNKKKQRRDWRWYASFGLNGIVALSMVLGTVFLFTGAPRPSAAVPTLEVPTAGPATVVPTSAPATMTPTVAPSVAPPTPTPKASVSDYTIAVAGDSRGGDAIYTGENKTQVSRSRRETWVFGYTVLTLITFGLISSAFGTVSVNTPFSNLASALSAWTGIARSIARENGP